MSANHHTQVADLIGMLRQRAKRNAYGSPLKRTYDRNDAHIDEQCVRALRGLNHNTQIMTGDYVAVPAYLCTKIATLLALLDADCEIYGSQPYSEGHVILGYNSGDIVYNITYGDLSALANGTRVIR